MQQQKGKHPSESRVEMVEVVLPNDTNPLGTILGGKVMHLIDMAGVIAAHRHSRSVAVTVAMDQVQFLSPVKVGELIILQAQVTAAFHTSMEVEVKVFSENLLSGVRRPTSSAFLTFVAIDEKGQLRQVPPLIPQTREEKRKLEEARRRRQIRLRKKGKSRVNLTGRKERT
ncbi:MAG: acyl-CoA thioesterase [Acidobacteria bacterium]|nr:acyl-CoA thioesterase [Acidobacteriota bacterium]